MDRKFLVALTALAFAGGLWVTYGQALGKHRRVMNRKARTAASTSAPLAGDSGTAKQPSVRPASTVPARATNGAYQWLEANGLGAVVRILERIRIHLVDPRAKLWIVFLLLLERLIPAKPIRSLFSANKLQDFLYPILSATVSTVMLLVAHEPVRELYDRYFWFTHTRLLDELPLLWQGVGAFLALDLMNWLSHYARHKIGWLWHFHSIHHSQVELNPLTAFRSHPLESFLISSLVLIPTAIFGGDRATWIGVSAFYYMIWPPLIHSNVRTNLGPLRHLLVSPQYHRVHHSVDPRQHDHNFGEHLIAWDWLFGTMWRDADSYPDTGIPNGRFIEERSRHPLALAGMWARQFVYPFIMIGLSLRNALALAADRTPPSVKA